jgi:hypothetical protein
MLVVIAVLLMLILELVVLRLEVHLEEKRILAEVVRQAQILGKYT